MQVIATIPDLEEIINLLWQDALPTFSDFLFLPSDSSNCSLDREIYASAPTAKITVPTFLLMDVNQRLKELLNTDDSFNEKLLAIQLKRTEFYSYDISFIFHKNSLVSAKYFNIALRTLLGDCMEFKNLS